MSDHSATSNPETATRSRSLRGLAAAASLLCAGALGACGGTTSQESQSGPVPGTIPSQPATAAPQPGSVAPKACDSSDMSGCYGYADAQKIADYSIDYVDRATTSLYSSMPAPAHIWYVGNGETGSSGCRDTTDTDYMFCPGDDTITLGQNMLWNLYDKGGDAAPLFGYAHEYGHHIQYQANVPQPQNGRQTINLENQADCIAGAIFAELLKQGIATDQDLEDIASTIPIIASVPEYEDETNTPRNHGTVQERTESTLEGIQGGLAKCNEYYPDTPILGK